MREPIIHPTDLVIRAEAKIRDAWKYVVENGELQPCVSDLLLDNFEELQSVEESRTLATQAWKVIQELESARTSLQRRGAFGAAARLRGAI